MPPALTSERCWDRALLLLGLTPTEAAALVAARVWVHVTSCFVEQGSYRVLAIGEQSPKSEADFFVLNLARALAGSIVISGKLLRDEPSVSFRLQGASAPGLAQLRAQLGLTEPPQLELFTRLPQHTAAHPALRELPVRRWSDRSAHPRHLESVGPGTISIEAGPSVARALYEPSRRVGQLWLTHFEGAVAPAARGPELLPVARVSELFGPPLHQREVPAANGVWHFLRYGVRA